MELKNNQDLEKNAQGSQDELLKIIEQLEWCSYECQGGPLEMNTAFIRLKELAHGGGISSAKLDRSRWEGCDYCKVSCGNCIYSDYSITKEPCKSCELEKDHSFVSRNPGLYCRECGRPLKEEAWAELERRINDGTVD